VLTLAEYVTPHRCAGLCGRHPSGGSSSRQIRKLFDGGQQARQTRRVGLVVWVDDWQMQCCGEPFGVGSEVAWTVSEADGDWLDRMLGPDARSRVDAAEDHHGQLPAGTPRTRGTVIGIRAVIAGTRPSPAVMSGHCIRCLAPVLFLISNRQTAGHLTWPRRGSWATSWS